MLLLTLFAGFSYALHSNSDPVFLALGKLDVPTVEVPRTPQMVAPRKSPPPVAARPLSLRTLLTNEIGARRLEVVAGPHGRTETVVIQGDNLFRSGRASINKAFRPLLKAIGDALQRLPGRVLVTGHTDSVPIRTANLELREWSWSEGDCRLTIWLHRVEGAWRSFENVRWHWATDF